MSLEYAFNARPLLGVHEVLVNQNVVEAQRVEGEASAMRAGWGDTHRFFGGDVAIAGQLSRALHAAE